jgi:hypothetical protein
VASVWVRAYEIELSTRLEPKKVHKLHTKVSLQVSGSVQKDSSLLLTEGALQKVQGPPWETREWEETNLHWIGSQEGHLAAARLLREMGEKDYLPLEVEEFPMKACPF